MYLDLQPRRHITAARIKANPTRHRIQLAVTLYGRSVFSAVNDDSLLIKLSVSLLHPPVHDRIIGVKVPCSMSLIRSSYLHIFAFSPVRVVCSTWKCLWNNIVVLVLNTIMIILVQVIK